MSNKHAKPDSATLGRILPHYLTFDRLCNTIASNVAWQLQKILRQMSYDTKKGNSITRALPRISKHLRASRRLSSILQRQCNINCNAIAIGVDFRLQMLQWKRWSCVNLKLLVLKSSELGS